MSAVEQKVKHILPRHERFADTREDRFSFWPDKRRKVKPALRSIAKRYSTLFKNLRKDARFAAPKLGQALNNDTYSEHPVAMHVCKRSVMRHGEGMHWDDNWATLDNSTAFVQSTTAAHPSLKDPSKIACYPTRADSARRREVVMSPGKFFAAACEPAPAHRIQSLAEAYLASQAPATVFFIDNDDCVEEDLGDEWSRVYRSARGFSSCMVGFDDTSFHPARFYARKGNGLALAYMTHDNTPDGDVVARSIVNLEKNLYVRIYGDARLGRALEAEPYRLECNAEAALRGVMCNAKTRNNQLVAPYIDGGMMIQWDKTSDYCRITDDGNYEADNTSGFANDGESSSCDECGDRCHEDDMAYSDHHDIHICPSCRENEFTYAYVSRHNQEYVRDDNVIHLGSEAYLNESEVLQMHGWHWSEHAAEHLHEDDAIYLEYLQDWVPEDDCVKLSVKYGDDGYALADDTKTIERPTLVVHEDYDESEVDEAALAA